MKLFSGYMFFIYHVGIPENRDTTPSLVINGKPHVYHFNCTSGILTLMVHSTCESAPWPNPSLLTREMLTEVRAFISEHVVLNIWW